MEKSYRAVYMGVREGLGWVNGIWHDTHEEAEKELYEKGYTDKVVTQHEYEILGVVRKWEKTNYYNKEGKDAHIEADYQGYSEF